MAQSLLLGLGGTGSRIVNNVAMELKKKKIGINDGNVCCVVLDTNENDRKKIKRRSKAAQPLALQRLTDAASPLRGERVQFSPQAETEQADFANPIVKNSEANQ